jgi:hypothetical protein
MMKAAMLTPSTAEDVVAVDDDVPEIDADAVANTDVLGNFGFAFRHRSLHRGGALYGVHNARKFDQQAIASGVGDAPVVSGYFAIYEFRAMVRSSSASMSHENPTISAARMAASFGFTRGSLFDRRGPNAVGD